MRSNPKAAQAVWPKADVKGLGKAFEGIEKQTLVLDCRIRVEGARAVATCGGTMQYVPKRGDRSPRKVSSRYEFNLREVNDKWSIDKVVTSEAKPGRSEAQPR